MKNNNTNVQPILLMSVIVSFLILNILFNLPVAAFFTSLYIASLIAVFLKSNWQIMMEGNALTDFGDKLISSYHRISKKLNSRKSGSE